MIELIRKKRDGGQLTEDEVERLVRGVVDGSISDVQTGAFLMALFIRGLSCAETNMLTSSMRRSGHELHWPEAWADRVVDKHSTGGVGDKVSLVLAPALAACGARVPMVSGRGLVWTGGTLDKLEAVPGFRVAFTAAQVEQLVAEIGCCIVGQSDDLVPADRRLYAARHLTATVDHPALITASIVSKKAAENVARLVLDVKCGQGALCATLEAAETLARRLVAGSQAQGIRTTAAITPMDNPVGRAIGNALEVAEAVELLRHPSDKGRTCLLFRLVTELGGELLSGVGLASDRTDGASRIECSLRDGSALVTFGKMLEAQGVTSSDSRELCHGDPWKVLPRSPCTTEIRASTDGYVGSVDALALGRAALALGAGKLESSDVIDPSVGLELLVDIGTLLQPDQAWLRVHHRSEELAPQLIESLGSSLSIVSQPPSPKSAILRWIDDDEP